MCFINYENIRLWTRKINRDHSHGCDANCHTALACSHVIRQLMNAQCEWIGSHRRKSHGTLWHRMGNSATYETPSTTL